MNDSDFRSNVVVNLKVIKCMLLVSRVENADMFALYFLGKPSSIYDKDNPDWAPSQKLGYDCNKVTESSQERYNRAQERVEKRRRSEGAIALLELSKATMEETMDTGVTVEESNCKACQTETGATARVPEGNAFGRAPIPLQQQVLALVWSISNSEVIRAVSDRFDVTMSSMDKIIRRVSRACMDMRQEYIKWPTRTLRISELCQSYF